MSDEERETAERQKHCECGNVGRHPILHGGGCPVREDYEITHTTEESEAE